ncbi:hypothetical protein N7492_008989 [Penicillium capsulatum]|uniref:Zn(2)-C6 fungal-type domain-containing protein n=1 Tax=Penicillium capsulatum TaxID=69766 RepID=A0A9W9HUK3_9EURO|nr:hypothetical protein N7492_008989 [Penicillium capsulatum]
MDDILTSDDSIQMDTEQAVSSVIAAAGNDQDQNSGMDLQQRLPTSPIPPLEAAVNPIPRGRGRSGFIDNADRWTAEVKRLMTRSKRTGQACNRCKARKLRCDSAPGGCFHCFTANQRCMVTDRTTGDTFERGECARLHATNASLREEIAALKQANERLEQELEALRMQIGYSMFSELLEPSLLDDANLVGNLPSASILGVLRPSHS